MARHVARGEIRARLMYVLHEKNTNRTTDRSSLEERASLGARPPCPELSLLYKWVPEGQELVPFRPVLPFDLLAERRLCVFVVGVLRRVRVVLGLLDVVTKIIPVWKSNFGRPTPSTRRRARHCICAMARIPRHRREIASIHTSARWRSG